MDTTDCLKGVQYRFISSYSDEHKYILVIERNIKMGQEGSFINGAFFRATPNVKRANRRHLLPCRVRLPRPLSLSLSSSLSRSIYLGVSVLSQSFFRFHLLDSLICFTHFSSARHQQGAQGQAQSTYRTVTNNINTIHAGPYQSVAQPTGYPTLRPTIIRAPSMAQQQQRPARPQQASQGIPSHSSQIEGLSVSQAVVNDVLVDLQSKVINETLQQYQGESARATDLGKATRSRRPSSIRTS